MERRQALKLLGMGTAMVASGVAVIPEATREISVLYFRFTKDGIEEVITENGTLTVKIGSKLYKYLKSIDGNYCKWQKMQETKMWNWVEGYRNGEQDVESYKKRLGILS